MMSWNWRAIRAIIRKDLKMVLQNRMVWVPMILVPAILLVVLPLVTLLIPTMMGSMESELDELTGLLDQMPAALRASIEGLNGTQQYVILSSNYMFAPMFLMIPLMVSSVLGADSFAGEKERKTLEALLYTPATDTELFVAKVLAALIPALVINLASFFIYGIIANLAGYPIMGRIYFPTASWWPLVFWVGPAIAVAGLGATVLVSSKAKSFVQTQQMSGMLVLPIVFLMIGQISGLFFLGPTLLIAIGLGVWLIGIWLIWIGAKTFARGEIISRI